MNKKKNRRSLSQTKNDKKIYTLLLPFSCKNKIKCPNQATNNNNKKLVLSIEHHNNNNNNKKIE